MLHSPATPSLASSLIQANPDKDVSQQGWYLVVAEAKDGVAVSVTSTAFIS